MYEFLLTQFAPKFLARSFPTAQKMKFSIKDFFAEKIPNFLRVIEMEYSREMG